MCCPSGAGFMSLSVAHCSSRTSWWMRYGLPVWCGVVWCGRGWGVACSFSSVLGGWQACRVSAHPSVETTL